MKGKRQGVRERERERKKERKKERERERRERERERGFWIRLEGVLTAWVPSVSGFTHILLCLWIEKLALLYFVFRIFRSFINRMIHVPNVIPDYRC